MSDKAGIERDREIAEIRGECLSENVVDGKCPDCGRMAYGACKYYIKPYSTSIVHAMELWEEMKGEGVFPAMVTFPDGVECELVNEDEFEISDTRHKGETEADAISGCWLKWNEQS